MWQADIVTNNKKISLVVALCLAAGWMLVASVPSLLASPGHHPTLTGSSSVGAGSPRAANAPSRTPLTILYNQYDNPGGVSLVSQNFEAVYDAYDARAADDFNVPANTSWTIQQVNVQGLYFNGNGPADSFSVFIYTDSGGKPADPPNVSRTNMSYTLNGTDQFQITINPPINIAASPSGQHLWIAVQANLDFAAGGEWGWTDRVVQSNDPAAWENPGGGFGVCPAWDVLDNCFGGLNDGDDFVYSLLGTTGVGGDSPPANDACTSAFPIVSGRYLGTTAAATNDGDATCSSSDTTPDVWYSYTPTQNGTLDLTTCDPETDYDTAISVHSACPGDDGNELACSNDDPACPSSPLRSTITALPVTAGQKYLIRVHGFAGHTGRFGLTVNGPATNCVEVFGMTHCPLGGAVVGIGPMGELTVNNIGHSGADGVSSFPSQPTADPAVEKIRMIFPELAQGAFLRRDLLSDRGVETSATYTGLAGGLVQFTLQDLGPEGPAILRVEAYRGDALIKTVDIPFVFDARRPTGPIDWLKTLVKKTVWWVCHSEKIPIFGPNGQVAYATVRHYAGGGQIGGATFYRDQVDDDPIFKGQIGDDPEVIEFDDARLQILPFAHSGASPVFRSNMTASDVPSIAINDVEVSFRAQLTAAGDCPGVTTVDISGATPGGAVGIYAGGSVAPSFITNGTCEGTALLLENPLLVREVQADGSGDVSFSANVGAGLCGFFLEAVDYGSCVPSAAVPLSDDPRSSSTGF